jgi:hypothetical protein
MKQIHMKVKLNVLLLGKLRKSCKKDVLQCRLGKDDNVSITTTHLNIYVHENAYITCQLIGYLILFMHHYFLNIPIETDRLINKY